MSTLPPSTVATILSDILAACQDAYGQENAPDVPSRAFVTHGTPMVEGEQLTVASLGISAVHPFPLAQLRALRSSAVGSTGVSIEVWRSCWPLPQGNAVSKTFPDPAAFTKGALSLVTDAATIWGWISRLAVEGGLIPSLPTISVAADVSLSPMVPLGPTGQVVGFRLPLAVKLSVPGQ